MSASARCRSRASSSSASGTSGRRGSRERTVGRAQCADEPRSRVAALIDEVRERVEAVEEEVRIDFASEAFELGLQPRLFQAGAAQSIALPVAQQEHGLVDVGDGDRRARRRRREQWAARSWRVPASPVTSRQIHSSASGNRDRVETDHRQEQAEPAPGSQQPVLAARQPEVQPSIAFPDDERDQREPGVRGDQPAVEWRAWSINPDRFDDQGARGTGWPALAARNRAPRAGSVRLPAWPSFIPAVTVSAKAALMVAMGRTL